MNIFNSLGSGFLGYIVPFLAVLTLVVFVHELGHFLIARLNGVKVLVFSIGFGPELIGFNDRYGTRWKLAAIPLGGYVKFFGDAGEASAPDQDNLAQMTAEERKVSFHHKSVGARAAVVAAGPFANFLLAIAIFTAIFAVVGKPMTSARVDAVIADSAAQKAGFEAGDVIVAIDGQPIESFEAMQRVVGINAGRELVIDVRRGDTPLTLRATPAQKEIKDAFGNTHRTGVLGISRSMGTTESRTQTVSLPQAFVLAVKETWFIIERTGAYIAGIVSGRESADQVGGPIRIAQVSGQVASIGLGALLNLAAVLSVSIGLLNLLPVPLLDGGHLLFYAIEAVRGRPLSDSAQEMGFRIGLAFVLMLMIFATYNDILHLTSS